MDELQKAYKEIGRLQHEKNAMIGTITTLFDSVSKCKSEGKVVSTDVLIGFLGSFLVSYKKEE